jgi:hypothetical protein
MTRCCGSLFILLYSQFKNDEEDTEIWLYMPLSVGGVTDRRVVLYGGLCPGAQTYQVDGGEGMVTRGELLSVDH